MAEKEIQRRAAIEDKLSYLNRQIHQLKIVDIEIPAHIPHSKLVINRALDVHTAAINYISAQIKHESQYFGLAGFLICA